MGYAQANFQNLTSHDLYDQLDAAVNCNRHQACCDFRDKTFHRFIGQSQHQIAVGIFCNGVESFNDWLERLERGVTHHPAFAHSWIMRPRPVHIEIFVLEVMDDLCPSIWVENCEGITTLDFVHAIRDEISKPMSEDLFHTLYECRNDGFAGQWFGPKFDKWQTIKMHEENMVQFYQGHKVEKKQWAWPYTMHNVSLEDLLLHGAWVTGVAEIEVIDDEKLRVRLSSSFYFSLFTTSDLS